MNNINYFGKIQKAISRAFYESSLFFTSILVKDLGIFYFHAGDARLTTDVISFYNAISGHEKLLSGLKGIRTRAVCK